VVQLIEINKTFLFHGGSPKKGLNSVRYALDKELDKIILKYVRYADDFSI
jgi:hypothetical protein